MSQPAVELPHNVIVDNRDNNPFSVLSDERSEQGTGPTGSAGTGIDDTGSDIPIANFTKPERFAKSSSVPAATATSSSSSTSTSTSNSSSSAESESESESEPMAGPGLVTTRRKKGSSPSAGKRAHLKMDPDFKRELDAKNIGRITAQQKQKQKGAKLQTQQPKLKNMPTVNTTTFLTILATLLTVKFMNPVQLLLRVGYTSLFIIGTLNILSRLLSGRNLLSRGSVQELQLQINLEKIGISIEQTIHDAVRYAIPMAQKHIRFILFGTSLKRTFTVAALMFIAHRMLKFTSTWSIMLLSTILGYFLPHLYNAFKVQLNRWTGKNVESLEETCVSSYQNIKEKTETGLERVSKKIGEPFGGIASGNASLTPPPSSSLSASVLQNGKATPGPSSHLNDSTIPVTS